MGGRGRRGCFYRRGGRGLNGLGAAAPGKRSNGGKGKDDKGGNRAAQVGFVVVREEAVPITTALGGRTVAFETSEVRPQVNSSGAIKLFLHQQVSSIAGPVSAPVPALYPPTRSASVTPSGFRLVLATFSVSASLSASDRMVISTVP